MNDLPPFKKKILFFISRFYACRTSHSSVYIIEWGWGGCAWRRDWTSAWQGCLADTPVKIFAIERLGMQKLYCQQQSSTALPNPFLALLHPTYCPWRHSHWCLVPHDSAHPDTATVVFSRYFALSCCSYGWLGSTLLTWTCPFGCTVWK